MTPFGGSSGFSALPSHATGELEDAYDAELIFRCASAFDRMTAQMRRAMGINAHERLAIALLWDRGPMTMSELGSGIPLSRAAVTTLVDRLVDAGYVERGGDESDRRRTVVSITAEGAYGIQPLLGPWNERLDELRTDIGEAGWSAVRMYLTSMHRIASSCADDLSGLDDETLRTMAITPTDTGANDERD